MKKVIVMLLLASSLVFTGCESRTLVDNEENTKKEKSYIVTLYADKPIVYDCTDYFTYSYSDKMSINTKDGKRIIISGTYTIEEIE